MVVVFYDTKKGEHVTINNVYSVLDDKRDGFVTVCWSNKDETREYSTDIPKEYLTSITATPVQEGRDISNNMSETDTLCDKIASAEQEKQNMEIATVEMTYAKMCSLFRAVEQARSNCVSGYVVFTVDSFTAPYSESSRTYEIHSDNKAYQPNMGGYSIYGSSLDGSDLNVRLDQYMAAEHGGKDGWKIERCYMKQSEFNKAQAIAASLERDQAR